MGRRRRERLVAGSGLFVLGASAPITSRFGRIETNTDVLLVAAGLGAVGAVTECVGEHDTTGDIIVATESQCTPDRTTALRSVCQSFQLLL
ncbi:hypothetical protein FGF80_14455 [Natrinema pallidum]|uniref:Uncharacterized protein n=1 Tax=Natrinema pallidum TaxID=69527 RepID=A0A4P9THU2_9EURY|nr:hypothetical protein FGF80_14455 [Natrinema pallidum]